jgi:hypothetical protein
MKAKTPKQVLKAAEWILNHLDWCQGTNYRDKNGDVLMRGGNPKYLNHVGSACLNGALLLVETTVPSGSDFMLRQRAEELFETANNIHGLVSFNDHPGRTKEEVLAAIRKAINFKVSK